MRVLVTGAAGFVGRALVPLLRQRGHALTLLDRALEPFESAGDLRLVRGDIREPGARRAALEDAAAVIHLATVAGGAAELDPALAREVNVEAALALSAEFARARPGAPFVFASSIAVLGHPLPQRVDDTTPLAPRLLYGAHKAMIEQWLACLSRRGDLAALSLRLPGIVARPAGPSGMKSGFISDVFHALAAHRPIELPVSPAATMWLMSVRQTARCLAHALEAPVADGPPERALTLPAVRASMGELVAEIACRSGADPGLVTYRPDTALEDAFGRQPPLVTPAAVRLGFASDGDLAALVRSALEIA